MKYYKLKLSFEKVITFTEEVEVDETDYLHLQDMEESRPHSFLMRVKELMSEDVLDDPSDNYDTGAEMELISEVDDEV